jgi:ABC-type sulfate/molybdate transport systems ATPase subunit
MNRVLALEPEVLLLDEPFSHIDNFRKNSLRRKLFNYLKEKQITTIIATHDSTDVLSFADEVLVMKEGEIIEKGTPNDLYQNPKNKYIASLFGDVNEIAVDGKMQLVYPHQLEIVSNSSLEVEVLQSYFRGNIYLVEAKYLDSIIYFESNSNHKKGEKVFLAIKK